MPTVTFVTSNNVMFEVDVEILKVAENIETLLDTHLQLGLNGSERNVIDLPTIESNTFAKLIDWMIRHRDEYNAAEESEKETEMKKWEKTFFSKLNVDSLTSLMAAAKNFSVKCLEKSLGEYMANALRDESPAMSKWILLFGKEALSEQGLDNHHNTSDEEE